MAKAISLPAIVDRLGETCAQISDLNKQHKSLVAALRKATRAKQVDGRRYRALLETFDRETLNRQAVIKALGLKWVKSHMNKTKVSRCRVVARKISR